MTLRIHAITQKIFCCTAPLWLSCCSLIPDSRDAELTESFGYRADAHPVIVNLRTRHRSKNWPTIFFYPRGSRVLAFVGKEEWSEERQKWMLTSGNLSREEFKTLGEAAFDVVRTSGFNGTVTFDAVENGRYVRLFSNRPTIKGQKQGQ